MEGVNWFYTSLGLTVALIISVLLFSLYFSFFGLRGEAALGALSSSSFESTSDYNALFVGDQIEGNSVVVSLLSNSKPGFVVIQEENNGLPGRAIGVSDFFNSGERSRVVLDLVRPMREGERFYAIIYEDNGDKAFDIKTDRKARNEEGGVAMMTFVVTDGESQPTSVTI